MTTIAAGNHQQIYFDQLDDIVITPGSGGTVKFDCSTPNSAATRPTARIIYSETSISIPAGSTVFLDAVGADATYDRYTYPSMSSLESAYPASSNAGNSEMVGGVMYFCNGAAWRPIVVSGPGSVWDGAAPRKTTGAIRPIGVMGSFSASSATNFGGRFEAETTFSRVRFRIYSKVAATNFKMVAAVTESDAITGAPLSSPVVSSTAYTALRADNVSPGWATVTKASLSTFDLDAAPTLTKAYSETVTDWIDMLSITRADGGTRPLIMWRLEHNGSTDGNWTRASAFDRWASEAVGQPWYRVMRCMTGTSVVTTLSNALTITSNGIVVFPEFDYDVPVETWMSIGDSNTENGGGYATGSFGSWPFIAAYTLSAPSKPIQLVNAGVAGGTSTEFSGNGVDEILRVKPDKVFYAPTTPNDAPYTAATAAVETMRLAAVRDACWQVGARLFVVSGIPNSTVAGAGQDAYRLQLSTYADTLAAQGGCVHINLESLLGTGASPNRIKAEYNAGDNIHINAAGNAAMATAVITAVTPYLLGGAP